MTENDGNRHIFMIYSPVFVFFSESGLFLGLDAIFKRMRFFKLLFFCCVEEMKKVLAQLVLGGGWLALSYAGP